ncbi:MAG: TolC family protein, partial [Candidatus Riflebacteria bacterium]|nr:TolC family protein [Candidatus Riflebacteria bacterium]
EVLPLQKTKAEVELAASRAALERLRRELGGARVQLVSMWGGTTADLGPLVMPDAGTLPPIPTAEEALRRVASHPALALADNGVDGARIGLRSARAEAAPDLEITAGYRRFRETGDRAAMAGFAITLPLFDRKRGEIRGKQEHLAAAVLRAQDARLEVGERILDALERLQGLRRGIELHRETILPGAEENFTATERGYRLGELTLLDLLDAQRTLLAARRATLDMQAEAYQLFAELEFWLPGLTGKRGAP